MTSTTTVKMAVVGLMTLAYASASAISDITQIPNSNFGIYGLIVGTGLGTGPQTANPSSSFYGGSSLSTVSIDANAAFGFNANAADIQLFSDVIAGNAGTSGTSNNCVGNGACYGGTLNGLLNTGTGVNGTTAAAAVLDATSLAATYLAYGTLTASLPKIADGTTKLNVTSSPGFHPGGNVNEDVYYVDPAFADNLTITLTASQYVVIDLGSGNGTLSNVQENLFGITLSGLTGVTDPYDHVLINVDSTGSLYDLTAHHGAINADVIDAYGKVSLQLANLNGRLYCSLEPGSCSVLESFDISASVNSRESAAEPPTFIFGVPLLAIGLAARRFRPADQPQLCSAQTRCASRRSFSTPSI
jgi:hypothetical protein